MKVVQALSGVSVMAFRTVFKTFIHRRPQIVIAFAGLLTLVWLALLVWVSSGILELI